MFDIVGVGTNSVDELLLLPLDAEDLAAAGKARVVERHIFCGGQAATTTVACAALGLRSSNVGAFGSDKNGTLMEETLASAGVDVATAVRCGTVNRSAIILIAPNGRRTVLWSRSESLNFPLPDLQAHILSGRIVHIDDDDPGLALRAAQLARSAGTPVTSDLEHMSDTVEELLASVTYPIMEQHLPCRLTGETDPERALRKLRRLNPGVLCMTLGERGAVALEGDTFHVAQACDVSVVDTTGAGDVFRAGFIYGLLRSWAVPEILRFANAAAAIGCARLGAIPSVPSFAEVEHFLATTY